MVYYNLPTHSKALLAIIKEIQAIAENFTNMGSWNSPAKARRVQKATSEGLNSPKE